MAGVRQSSEGSGLLGGEHAAQRCGVADLLRYNAARSRGAPGHARTASVLFLFVLLSITTPEDPWLELASSGLVFGCLLTLCCTFWVSQCPTVPVLLVTWICLSLEVQKWHLSYDLFKQRSILTITRWLNNIDCAALPSFAPTVCLPGTHTTLTPHIYPHCYVDICIARSTEMASVGLRSSCYIKVWPLAPKFSKLCLNFA